MSQVINPVNERDFLLVAFDRDILAVNYQDPREVKGITKGFGESGIVWQCLNFFPGLEIDLLARVAMFIAKFPKWYSVNVGDPEDGILASMINREKMLASLARVSFFTSATAVLDGLSRAANRTLGISFFWSY